MSMEICILSDARLSSITEWQSAIDSQDFPLRLSSGEPFAGFECYHVDAQELFETYDNIRFGREWKYVMELVWGGDFTEMQAAWMAATAYARATSGIIFDPQASELLTASQAVEVVRDNERVLPQLQAR